MNLKKLEQTGAIQVVMYLHNNTEASINELGRSLSVTVKTLRETTLEVLENELQLIKIEKTETFPFPHTCRLTEKGEKLALCLSQIND